MTLKDRLHWRSLLANCQRQQHATVTTVLALATLGSATKNRNDPICVVPPNVAKARTIVAVTCPCRWCYCAKTSPM
jgi:hypothetical protein